MDSVANAGELYRELKKRGLELRRGHGRDDALYGELVGKLRVPADGLQATLDTGAVALEDFVFAFFAVAQPFAQMYSDIYAEMQHQGAKGAAESLRMRFDFGRSGGQSLEFDLRHFREVMERMRRIEGLRQVSTWGKQDLHKLFDWFEMLRTDLPFKPPPGYYRRGKPYVLPPIPPVSAGLGRALSRIRDVFDLIIRRSVERQARGRSAAEAVGMLREAQSEEGREEEGREEDNLAGLLTDLMPGFERLLLQLAGAGAERTIGSSRIAAAVRFFEQDIASALPSKQVPGETWVRELIEFLNLPLWRHRWYLYEVWATLQTVSALEGYDARLALDGDQLRLEVGRPQVVANLRAAPDVSLQLWAQKQTRVWGVLGRKGIQPDLRLCPAEQDGREPTLVLLEFKQRKAMTALELARLINLYDSGTPGSLASFYLNYDVFPAVPPGALDHAGKSVLFDNFNPQHADQVLSFKRALAEVLALGGYPPWRKPFDILLLDVSGSMRSEYSTPAVLAAIDQLVKLFPDLRLYFFDDRLIVPSTQSAALVKQYLSGGTNLDVALEELRRREPQAQRLLVVTDGGYGEGRLLQSFEEARQYLPGDLGKAIKELQSPQAGDQGERSR
jgi:hypothetical protein